MQFRKLKAQKGFTLVEVIVVAVIVAILAGVSIPLYLGYINNSRENAAANAAGSAASFAAACVNGGKVFSLADKASVKGLADGTVRLTCNDNDAGKTEVAALIVPTDITLTRADNVITGQNANGGGPSQPFTFTTKAP